MHARAEALDNLGNNRAQDLPVVRPEEDVPAMITAHGDAIERTWDMNSQGSWHPCLRAILKQAGVEPDVFLQQK